MQRWRFARLGGKKAVSLMVHLEHLDQLVVQLRRRRAILIGVPQLRVWAVAFQCGEKPIAQFREWVIHFRGYYKLLVSVPGSLSHRAKILESGWSRLSPVAKVRRACRGRRSPGGRL